MIGSTDLVLTNPTKQLSAIQLVSSIFGDNHSNHDLPTMVEVASQPW